MYVQNSDRIIQRVPTKITSGHEVYFDIIKFHRTSEFVS